jgi:hypothetical protein
VTKPHQLLTECVKAWQLIPRAKLINRQYKNAMHAALLLFIGLGILFDPHAGLADWGFLTLAVLIELS